MPRQSYPVSFPSKPPEQPHLCEDEDRTRRTSYRGWFAFIIAGAVSAAFLLVINFVTIGNIFPRYLDPYRNFVPIVKQGGLRLYPPYAFPSWKNDSYVIDLPPKNIQDNLRYLQEIIDGYPRNWTETHSQCWLQNPQYEKPCFFDASWLEQTCSSQNSFGYTEINKTFNPCVYIRLEQTGSWVPALEEKENLPRQRGRENYDPSFIKVSCYHKNVNHSSERKKISLFPEKGFSHLYFPADNFDPSLYLPPAVVLQLEGIQLNETILVQCEIYAKNSFLLWGDGTVRILFDASLNKT